MMEHKDADLNARIQKHWPGIAAGAGGIDLAAESRGSNRSSAVGRAMRAAGESDLHGPLCDLPPALRRGPRDRTGLTGYERQNLDFGCRTSSIRA